MRSLIDRLEHFPALLGTLIEPLSLEQARWRPRPGAWSILEIVGHIEEEERRDFRPRLESTLRDPDEAWAPIDPLNWVLEHEYQRREPLPTVRAFMLERARSVTWLRELQDPDWNRVHEHARLGRLRAGDLLAAWAAHDTLHLRQIARRLYEGVVAEAGEFRCDYAGDWT